MKHGKKLICRFLFLEGTPTVSNLRRRADPLLGSRIFRDGLVAVSDGTALVLSLDTDDPDVDFGFDDLRVYVVKRNGNFR